MYVAQLRHASISKRCQLSAQQIIPKNSELLKKIGFITHSIYKLMNEHQMIPC